MAGVIDGDGEAVPGQARGDRGTDAAGGAGHDRDFLRLPVHGDVPSEWLVEEA
jgi:hypothetical protein